MESPESQYVVTVDAGADVFRLGDAASCAFIVESGEVVLVREDGSVVERLGPGDVFGEGALERDEQRATSARAESATTLLRIERDLFPDLVAASPAVAVRIVGSLSRRRERAAQRAAEPTGERPGVAAPTARPRLVHASGAEFSIPEDGVTLVGRADPRKGFTPEIELSALDSQRSLSRRHARVYREGQTFFVQEEPGVRNGTFVNGRRLSSGVSVAVKDGDEVAFGLIKTLLRVG